MASQRILLLAIGGLLAERVWEQVCKWSDRRTTVANDEWSPDDWPHETRNEINTFVERISSEGLVPPILYRSEHVDCWSMGDVFQDALLKKHPDYCRQLYTAEHEIIATRVRFTEQPVIEPDSACETQWLHKRINEAIAAWGELADERLIVLIRTVIGPLWEDQEVTDSLKTLPAWWTE